MVCKVSNLVFWKPNVTQHPPMHHLEKTHFGFSCGWNPIQPLLGSRWVLGKNKNKHSILLFPFFTFFLGVIFLPSYFLLTFNPHVFSFHFFLLCSNKFIEQLSTFLFWFVLQWSSLVCFLYLVGAMKPLLSLQTLFQTSMIIHVSFILEHF